MPGLRPRLLSNVKNCHWLFFALLVFSAPQSSAKRAGNRPYVSTMDGMSVFYARCIPDEVEGNKGTTTIYVVRKDGDKKTDVYPWYSPGGLYLGWSPIAGKVAVMSLREKAPTREQQVEFSFHLGGKLIKSYTTKDLEKMGVKIEPLWEEEGEGAQFRVLGCIQVPNTNDYDFVVESGGKKLAFDILTGEPRVSAAGAGKSR